jgi:hypothetical protein
MADDNSTENIKMQPLGEKEAKPPGYKSMTDPKPDAKPNTKPEAPEPPKPAAGSSSIPPSREGDSREFQKGYREGYKDKEDNKSAKY